MKITALVTIESPPTAAGLEPFVLVYDLFTPEDAVEAIRRHVAGEARLPGYDGHWAAKRVGRSARVLLTGRSIRGGTVDVQDLVANVAVLSRFTQSVSCPSCEATSLWSALQFGSGLDLLVVREAVAVGCDECGWIASDHPVAGHPAAGTLDDQVEILGAQA